MEYVITALCVINILLTIPVTIKAARNHPKKPEPCQTTEALLEAAREGMRQTLELIDKGEYEHAYRHLERIQGLIAPIEYDENNR